VTSGVRAVAEHRLRHVDLPMPPVMICADDVSAGKPSPEGYLAAAARLGVPPGACIVVAITTTHAREALRLAEVVLPRLSALRVRVNRRRRARQLEIDAPFGDGP